MDVVVTVLGDKELVGRINRFVQGDLDLRRSLGQSGLFLTRFFSGEVFASRGRIIGQPWPRLNDQYAAWKARRFSGRPPLVRSGEMLRSFGHEVQPRSLSLFNTADHFDFHQEGTRRIPQRMMMRIDDQRAIRVGNFIGTDITEQLRRAGLI